MSATSNGELLKKIRDFYVNDQGNLDATAPPLAPGNVAELLIRKASALVCESLLGEKAGAGIAVKSRILLLVLAKTPEESSFDVPNLLSCFHGCLSKHAALSFTTFSSILTLSTHLHAGDRIQTAELSDLVTPLVRHAWGFLSASEPKYHVEAVRGLWHLQTALTPENRDI